MDKDMNEIFYRIGDLQKKLDKNRTLQTYMKGTGALLVFTIFACSFNQPDTMKTAWLLSIIIIGLLFVFHVYYIRQSKRYEFEIYQSKIKDLENKKKLAQIKGEVLPDFALNQEIRMPSREISLPILYYAILIILDILIKVFMIS